ncbi:PorP/SprF family type IX secretion system membrane protein [Aureivirga sp. CE67]|uniref:PorP/SprF family type IX secretion system membrane protein n=1 Tax=Aureivirga sp. CE67 TaxID=1788983 RepID=UPI0018C9A241|nr:PorP/SprF family type IX secretion system membrane protein [Aureivirga sp. CE67]
MLNIKTIILTIIVFVGIFNVQQAYAQDDEVDDKTRIGVSINIPTHNFVKYNSFLLNPTFSFIVQKNRAFTLYSRTQWVDFENSPEILMMDYAGAINEKSGLGLGIYQHTTGVIKNFGGLANYAYGIKLSEKIMLSLGFNLNYFKSGLNIADIQTSGVYDPLLEEIGNESLVTFAPGLNLTLGSFDVGVYSNNLVDYNFRTKKELTAFSDKTFSGHLMYTKRFDSGKLLNGGRLSVMALGEKEGQGDISYGGNFILEIPRLWINAGYNSFYGASAGIGVNFAEGSLSLGYTIEKGLTNELQYFGATHDLYLSYNFLHSNKAKLPKTTDSDSEEDKFEQLAQEAEERENELNARIDQLEEALANINNSIEKDKEYELEKDKFAPRIESLISQEEVSGYYLIAFESDFEEDALSFSDKVNDKNFTSGSRIVYNAEANKYYSYLNVYKSKNAAIKQYYSLVDKKNADDIWILRVINDGTKVDPSSVLRYNDSNDNEDQEEETETEIIEEETEPTSVTDNQNIKTEEEIIKVQINRTHDIKPGYYIIANVFSNRKNAIQFMNSLQRSNLEADYFIRPLNNYYYVYLKRLDTKQEALKTYHSKVDGSYTNEIWILVVK